MKGSVILLGVCCFITLLAAGEGRCGTRSQRLYWQDSRHEISCMKPKRQLVQFQVPEGYDYVRPQTTMIHQCSGHQCPATNNQCVPMQTQDITLAVRAYKMNDYNGTCMDITVQEHRECGCGCTLRSSDCSHTQMLKDDTLCKCVCRLGLKTKCEKRIEKGLQAMWDEANCICKCDFIYECSSNQYWVPEVCGCRVMMSSSSEESNQDSSSSEGNGIYSKEWP